MVTYLKLVIFETVDESKGKTPGKQKSGSFGKVQQSTKTLAKPVSQGYLWVTGGPVIFIARGFHTPRDGSKGELRYVNMY